MPRRHPGLWAAAVGLWLATAGDVWFASQTSGAQRGLLLFSAVIPLVVSVALLLPADGK